MATKDKKPAAKKAAPEGKVTRIKASSASAKKETKAAKAKKAEAQAPETKQKGKRDLLKPFKAIGGYFAGAWYELKQVRWPNRRATWGMTVAMLAFTAFFVALILLLDALFKYLFEIILG